MLLGAEGVIEPRTFHQLVEGSTRWATQLREHGVRSGDRVLVLVASKLSWIEVMLAGIKIGAVTVPCPQTLSAAALDIRIASAGAKLIVAGRTSEVERLQTAERPTVLYVEDVQELSDRPAGDEPAADTTARDLAFILSTSGTAYGPHGVAHTHAAAFAARVQAEQWLDADVDDVVWCTSETDSALAVWNVLLGPWARGAEIVVHDGAFDPEERLDLIRRLEVTILCQTPAEYRALAETGHAVLRRYVPLRLRRMVSTGDSLSADVVAAFEDAWGIAIHDGYGQVECGTVVGYGPDATPRAGSIGLPLPGCDVLVVDASGNELPPGEEGDLAVRGRPPSLFSGYWEAPDETKAVFRGDLYITGDVARRDGDGHIHLLGRAQDVITSGEHRFSPSEVEEELLGHEAILDAGVVGSRDLERGGQFVRRVRRPSPRRRRLGPARRRDSPAPQAVAPREQGPTRDRVRRGASADAERQGPPARASRARCDQNAGRVDSRPGNVRGSRSPRSHPSPSRWSSRTSRQRRKTRRCRTTSCRARRPMRQRPKWRRWPPTSPRTMRSPTTSCRTLVSSRSRTTSSRSSSRSHSPTSSTRTQSTRPARACPCSSRCEGHAEGGADARSAPGARHARASRPRADRPRAASGGSTPIGGASSDTAESRRTP